MKFVGLAFQKILGIYCVSINPPGDLDLSPFDLFKIGSQVTRVMGFHPAKFRLPRPIRSRVMLRHGTDRRTDRPELSVGRVDPRVGSGLIFMRVYFCHLAVF